MVGRWWGGGVAEEPLPVGETLQGLEGLMLGGVFLGSWSAEELGCGGWLGFRRWVAAAELRGWGGVGGHGFFRQRLILVNCY